MRSRPVNDTGLNGTGPLVRGLLLVNACVVFCLPLGASDAEADHVRGSAPSHAGDRSVCGFGYLGGSQSQSRILNQRQCKFSGVRPYTQMSDSVEGRCP